MGTPARDLVRAKGELYDSLKLDDPSLSDEQLIDAMVAHPILMNRPIVVTPLGTRLCRPSEIVLGHPARRAAKRVRQRRRRDRGGCKGQPCRSLMT